MAQPSFTLHPHRLQRRLSVLLSMLICVWMLAAATHFHTPLDDTGAHHNAKELCGFCASLPSAGPAPSVWTFVPTDERHYFTIASEILPAFPLAFPASYRSRAPPIV